MILSGAALAMMAVSALVALRQTVATDAERLAFVLSLLLILSLSTNIWNGDPVQFRTFNDLWIYGAGILIGSRKTTLLSLTALGGGICLVASTLWKITTI
jgi:hypothetical protein